MKKKVETITVFYKGNSIIVFKVVADALGLKQGQRIETEAHFWEILGANCAHGISLCEHKLQTNPNNTIELGRAVLKDLELRAAQKGLVGVPYGIIDIDRKTGGFHKTDLTIIAGRPGMGKTGFALSLALNAAMEFNNPIGFFSLEMSGEQLYKRMVSMVAEVDGEKMRTGELEDFEWQKIANAIERLNRVPIYIEDTPAISILELRAKARRMKRQYGIKALFIDYLQLLTVGNEEQKGRNREQEISYISRALQSLAKQLDIPVIALAQLSRAVEIRGGSKRPQLSDLRESGSIENDADVIQFIYRTEYYKIYFPK